MRGSLHSVVARHWIDYLMVRYKSGHEYGFQCNSYCWDASDWLGGQFLCIISRKWSWTPKRWDQDFISFSRNFLCTTKFADDSPMLLWFTAESPFSTIMWMHVNNVNNKQFFHGRGISLGRSFRNRACTQILLQSLPPLPRKNPKHNTNTKPTTQHQKLKANKNKETTFLKCSLHDPDLARARPIKYANRAKSDSISAIIREHTCAFFAKLECIMDYG